MKKFVVYKFTVDTDSYSGNFERQLCAYCTGTIGDCGVGSYEQKLYLQDHHEPLTTLMRKDNDTDCYRPCDLSPTPGYGNDGMGNHSLLVGRNRKIYKYPAYQSVEIFFSRMPMPQEVAVMKRRAKKYLEDKKIRLLGFRLIKEVTAVENVRIKMPKFKGITE